MASKKGKPMKNAQAQNAVSERRLRPIYDWLDNGNNKKALQEAEKVLKRQPDFVCCRALKSLALIRLNRENEALPILDSITNAGTTDEGALQAMNIGYRELQQTHKICTMYENATKLEPNNEELLSQLFMSYVRIGAYKKQQTAAMALYKAKAKTPYYFWAVMSVVLQAKTSNEEKTANQVILPLAERMISKMNKEGKMEQEQETRLYLMVLEMQQKYKEALEILEGPLGQKLESTTSFLDFIINTKLNYHKKLEAWDQVNLLSKDILQRHPDQWNVYLEYITAVFRMVDQDTKNWAESVDSCVPDAVNFITFQKENHPKCRGPFLSQIELHSRLLARRDKDATLSEMTDLLISYFEKFGDKPCCGNDLKLYLPIIQDATETARFFEKTYAMISFENSDKRPKNEADVNKHICWNSLNRLMGKHHSITYDEKLQLAAELTGHFEKCVAHFTEYSPTVIRPYDNYVLMACQIYWELWLETLNNELFWKASILLSNALKISPASYNLRLLLIKFLNQIAYSQEKKIPLPDPNIAADYIPYLYPLPIFFAGAVGASSYFHTGLELKHVQLDSMGYILSRHIQSCGHFHASISLMSSTLKFFQTNYKDVIDFVISAYRCGSFDKILEFINLRQRLSASQHYALILVERSLMDLFVEAPSHTDAVQLMSYHEIDPEKDEIPWLDLTDNRDFKVMSTWDSNDRFDDLISESFMQDQRYLKYRSFMLRICACALYLSEDMFPPREYNGNTENGENNGAGSKSDILTSMLKNLLEKLITTHDDVIKNEANYKTLQNCINGPDRSRLTFFVMGEHVELLILLVKGVLEAQKCSQGGNMKEFVDKASSLFAKMSENVTKSCQIHSVESIVHREEHFERLVNHLESASMMAILLGVCQRLVAPNASKKKQKNRKNEAQPPNENMQVLDEVLNETILNLQTFHKFLNTYEQNVEQELLSESFSKKLSAIDDTNNEELEKIESCAEQLKTQIETSYTKTFMNLKNVANVKLNYLKCIRT